MKIGDTVKLLADETVGTSRDIVVLDGITHYVVDCLGSSDCACYMAAVKTVTAAELVRVLE